VQQNHVSSVETSDSPNYLLQSTFDEFHDHSLPVKFKGYGPSPRKQQQIEVTLTNAAIN
jgi:hypothetical protein